MLFQALRQLDADDRIGRADALYCLGEFCQIRGDLAKAEECYQKSLSEREKVGDREGMAASLAALASVYQFTGAAKQVESCLEKARHPGLILAICNINWTTKLFPAKVMPCSTDIKYS